MTQLKHGARLDTRIKARFEIQRHADTIATMVDVARQADAEGHINVTRDRGAQTDTNRLRATETDMPHSRAMTVPWLPTYSRNQTACCSLVLAPPSEVPHFYCQIRTKDSVSEVDHVKTKTRMKFRVGILY